jgi:hypothetical protein
VDFFNKWGSRLIKGRRLKSLFTRSRKPYRSPKQTKRRIEKKVLKIRRVEPYLGPERISMEMEDLYDLKVALNNLGTSAESNLSRTYSSKKPTSSANFINREE